MKRNPKAGRFTRSKTPNTPDESWHNGGDIEIDLYARSLHRAAKILIASLELDPNTKMAWDACPVVLLYRQSVELHPKAVVDAGCNFLAEPTDPLSLAKTHSLRWLAQIVGQIIKAVMWEDEFTCEGVSNLADFSALVSELDSLDPVAVAMRPGNRRAVGNVPSQLEPQNVIRLAKKLDALIDLLAPTADGLAATWEMHRDGISSEIDLDAGDGVKPTIQ